MTKQCQNGLVKITLPLSGSSGILFINRENCGRRSYGIDAFHSASIRIFLLLMIWTPLFMANLYKELMVNKAYHSGYYLNEACMACIFHIPLGCSLTCPFFTNIQLVLKFTYKLGGSKKTFDGEAETANL